MLHNPTSGNPRTVTIYPRDGEEALDKLQIHFQEKFRYTGPHASIICSSLADTGCSDLGISGLLERLNEVLGTRYAIDPSQSRESFGKNIESTGALYHILRKCIDDKLDFGMAYAQFRPWWKRGLDFALKEMKRRQTDDGYMRDIPAYGSLQDKNIYVIPPRRVWDLYANRVVPSWIAVDIQAALRGLGREKLNVVGVSHSWMKEEDRREVRTPINSFEWPVPIPADTTLERVRIELLNYGLEYVWLDVLCLRQAWKDPASEELRQKEWRLDVPTIGNIYQQGKKVVHYYSGLGRPFRIGNLESDRHWLNRAWTLQEIHPKSIIAGITDDSPVIDATSVKDGQRQSQMDEQARKFYGKLAMLADIAQGAKNIFPVLAAMRHRAATNEIDKICGLAYLLRLQKLPAYETGEPTEDAWWRFLESINELYRGELLFLYPEKGKGRYAWGPSWQQVKDAKVLPDSKDLKLFETVRYDKSASLYSYFGFRVDRCLLDGLEVTSGVSLPRKGNMIINDMSQNRHVFPVLAWHNVPIQKGHYTLIGSKQHQYWIVVLPKEGGEVEKVSVLRMCDGGEKWRLWSLGGVSESKLV